MQLRSCPRYIDLFIHREAVISPCKQYRYSLSRIWDEKLPPLVVGMLNPSTADHSEDDPTITRCMVRAQKGGFGSLIVWNLFAYRATNPKCLFIARYPVGPQNDEWIKNIILDCKKKNGILMLGWGSSFISVKRIQEVERIIAAVNIKTYCLGITKTGNPRHPLYVSYALGFSEIKIPTLKAEAS